MLLHIFTTKANHPQALMKIKPAILSLLPSATASGLAVSTLSGYGTAWPSNSSPGAKGLQTRSRTFVVAVEPLSWGQWNTWFAPLSFSK